MPIVNLKFYSLIQPNPIEQQQRFAFYICGLKPLNLNLILDLLFLLLFFPSLSTLFFHSYLHSII